MDNFSEQLPWKQNTVTSAIPYRTYSWISLATSVPKADPDCPTHLLYAQGRRPTESEKRLRGKHFPFRSSKRGRYVVCYNSKTPSGKHKDAKVVTYCPKCGVHLCIGGCFENFHMKSKYKAFYCDILGCPTYTDRYIPWHWSHCAFWEFLGIRHIVHIVDLGIGHICMLSTEVEKFELLGQISGTGQFAVLWTLDRIRWSITPVLKNVE